MNRRNDIRVRPKGDEIEVADKELSVMVWKRRGWEGYRLSVYQWQSDQITKPNIPLVNGCSIDYANYTHTTLDV